MVEVHKDFGVIVSGFGSIGSGGHQYRAYKVEEVNVLKEPLVLKLAKAKRKTPAQIVLRWHVQRGTVPLVKTSTESRLAENLAIHDFKLSQQEMAKMAELDADKRLFNPKYLASQGYQPYFE